jgi:hypothetical protein
MPIPVLLHAGLSFLTGELLVSGKLLGYLAYAAVLVLTYRMLRRMGTSVGLALGLVAGLTASWVAIMASLRVSYDGVATAPQLAAIMLVGRGRDRPAVVGAGALCAMAALSKPGAFWAPVAIAVWLWPRERRLLAPFLASWVGLTGVGVVAVQVASGGRFLRQLWELSSSAVGDGLQRVVPETALALAGSPALLPLLILAGIELVRARREGRLGLEHLSLLAAAAILLAVMTRAGASSNHFLDVAMLGTLGAGSLAARPDHKRVQVLVLIMVGLLVPLAAGLAFSAVESRSVLDADARFLERYLDPADRILAEDPSIPIALGQVPVVLDPFTLSTVGARHPELLRPLIERLEAGRFDAVVLRFPVRSRPPTTEDAEWYEMQFGSEVIGAIERNYVLLAGRKGYYIYAPRDGSS